MNDSAQAAPTVASVSHARPKCPRCGSSLHRSRARSLPEKFLRRVLRLKKYRCDGCGHRQWNAGSGTQEKKPRPSAPAPLVAAEKRRQRRDPIARRQIKRRWRQMAFTTLLVVIGGLMLGMYIARQYSNTPVQQAEE